MTNTDTQEYYLTCMYCGKPNVHYERPYRYCTSDPCLRDAQAMVFPKYPTTAIVNNVADVMQRNTDLSEALETALQTIEEQQREIIKYKTIAAEIYSRDKTLRYYEIDSARWDLIRVLISHHQQLHNSILLKQADPTRELDWLEQAYSTLTYNLSKYGVEPFGKEGEEIIVDHKYHKSYSPPGALAKIVSTGYYSSRSDSVIIKALTVGDQDVYPEIKS